MVCPAGATLEDILLWEMNDKTCTDEERVYIFGNGGNGGSFLVMAMKVIVEKHIDNRQYIRLQYYGLPLRIDLDRIQIFRPIQSLYVNYGTRCWSRQERLTRRAD